MTTLYRTFAGFHTHYQSDGEGRDTYIGHNNGGMSKASCVVPSPCNRRYADYLCPAPPTSVKTRKYLVDGTGRDTYVYPACHPSTGQSQFHQTLRGYGPIKYLGKTDVFAISQRRWRTRGGSQQSRRATQQLSLTERLSIPKLREKKFEIKPEWRHSF